jgi:hypothetical protein
MGNIRFRKGFLLRENFGRSSTRSGRDIKISIAIRISRFYKYLGNNRDSGFSILEEIKNLRLYSLNRYIFNGNFEIKPFTRYKY